jgi:F-type H+-transporting ATPase subunit b
METLVQDSTFWVAVALLIFLAVIVYLGIPGMVAKMLDARADGIRNELDQARRLRQEAEATLKQYEAKRVEAEQQAQAIVANAKAEAERIAAEANAQLQAQIERKTKAAEQKIAQAETAALAEVRAAAAAAAVQAAETVLKGQMTENKGDTLIDSAIRDLRAKLH